VLSTELAAGGRELLAGGREVLVDRVLFDLLQDDRRVGFEESREEEDELLADWFARRQRDQEVDTLFADLAEESLIGPTWNGDQRLM